MPLKTQAPVTFSGERSTAVHWSQSIITPNMPFAASRSKIPRGRFTGCIPRRTVLRYGLINIQGG